MTERQRYPDHVRIKDGDSGGIFCGGCGGSAGAHVHSITKRAAKARKNFGGVCKRCVHCMKAKET